jgi:sodium-dependent dicarboxylate transporter 2/3/5
MTTEGGSPWLRRRGLWIALAGFVLVEAALYGGGLEPRARHAAAVTAATALCWTLEALPLGAASLLPLALFPLLGVLTAQQAAAAYFDDINYLFLGGMILGHCLERWQLHRRIALGVVKLIGTSPRRIVLGFLLGTAFISLWISNTATAVMMAPIALAVLETAGVGRQDPDERAFAAALLLVVAYGANIGGIGTPIGTGPNFAFFGQFSAGGAVADLTPPAFLRWIAGMAPLALAVCLATWLVLTRWVVRVPAALPRLDAGFRQASRLGPWTAPEIRVGLVFLAAVILWITRTLPIERQELGWIGLFPADFFGATPPEDAITSSTVAIAMAFVAFVVPAGDGRGSRLADGEAIRAVPWDMLLLLGGGFAIAKAFTVSKLSDVLGRELAPVLGNGALGAWPIVLGLSAFVTFLSEVTSNTATALVMLPIAANLGRAAGVDPRIPMLTVTLASSLAFMLPIGTPPNAIVFASRRIPMPVMVGGGFVLNLAAILLSSAAVIWWVCPILGIPT